MCFVFFFFTWKNSSSPSNTFHSWVSASNSTISPQARHQSPETDSCYTRLLEYHTFLIEFFKGKCLVRFRGAWWTTGSFHRDEKSWTWLSEHSELLLTHTPTHTHTETLDCSRPGSSIHGILQARRVGCHFLQGIFLTQGWSPPLLCLLPLAGGFFTTGATCWVL